MKPPRPPRRDDRPPRRDGDARPFKKAGPGGRDDRPARPPRGPRNDNRPPRSGFGKRRDEDRPPGARGFAGRRDDDRPQRSGGYQGRRDDDRPQGSGGYQGRRDDDRPQRPRGNFAGRRDDDRGPRGGRSDDRPRPFRAPRGDDRPQRNAMRDREEAPPRDDPRKRPLIERPPAQAKPAGRTADPPMRRPFEDAPPAPPRPVRTAPARDTWLVRKRYLWKCRDRELQLGDRTLLMAILNVTPDSFSDGGKYSNPDRAYARAFELEDAGADIIDIGAESTRPGSERVSEEEELARLLPVLQRLQGKLGIPICVDTYKAGVAQVALDHGADIINDPSGLTLDPALAKVVMQLDAGLILNHMRGTPDTWAKLPTLKDPMGSVRGELEATVHRALRIGMQRERMVIDPGLGFGKRKEQNAELLARLPELASLNLPVMAGPSRKSFLAQKDERLISYATASAVAACVLAGAHIVRVHEVAEMKAVAQLADSILAAASA